jgi:tetratricopeptide (TPR) repeat protein
MVTGAGFVVIASLALGACGQFATLQARKSWKEANTFYRQQNYARAAELYEEVIEKGSAGGELQDELKAAYFFLANSYDNLYRPGRVGEPENDALLTKAVENYTLASERIPDNEAIGSDSPLRGMKMLSLQYLVAAYGPDKLNDPSQAEPVLIKMIEMNPTEPQNYFQLGKLYEDAGAYDAAEEMYVKAAEVRPNDSSVYTQLAAYYNRQGEFDKTMEALYERAEREPTNPEAHYIIANYYWDKVFRDFRLADPEKKDFIAKGLESIDKAIALKGDYVDALIYRGLLLRLEANMETNRARQQALISEAEELQARAKELQQRQVSGVGN